MQLGAPLMTAGGCCLVAPDLDNAMVGHQPPGANLQAGNHLSGCFHHSGCGQLLHTTNESPLIGYTPISTDRVVHWVNS